MKYGIYYAYWEQDWSADYLPYIEKTAALGFDCLEIACTPLPGYSREKLREIRRCARANHITLTAGHGPSAAHNLADADERVTKEAKAFYGDLLERLEILGIHTIGGGIYSYWPVDFSKAIDKRADWERSVINVREVGRIALDRGVDYCLEALNRFEGYLINTAAEALAFIREVDCPAVKVHLDTFHMNIEEDSMGGAIRTADTVLGHFHVGECNRRVPGKGRMPWFEIACALRDIAYDGPVVMEPFVRMGGQVGKDIHIWRDISRQANESDLDNDAADSLRFLKCVMAP